MLTTVEKPHDPSPAEEERFEELTSFIRENEPIRITSTSVAVPAQYREEFYRRVDKVLTRIVLDCPEIDLTEALKLSSAYQKVCRSLIKRTNLVGIEIPHSLKAFLDDPLDALAKTLYPLMFDLLQGKLSRDGFTQQANRSIEGSLRTLSRCGYEMWLFFSVIDHLDPVHFWAVDFGIDLQPIIQDTATFYPGRQHPLSERRIPDSAFETRTGARYALKFESVSEVGYYDVPITRRRDNTFAGNTRQVVGQRVLMIHRVSSFDELPTISDRDTGEVSSPTLAIEVSSAQELSIPAARLALGNRALSLDPSQGYAVILPEGTQGETWFINDYAQVKKAPNFKFIKQTQEDHLPKTIATQLSSQSLTPKETPCMTLSPQ